MQSFLIELECGLVDVIVFRFENDLDFIDVIMSYYSLEILFYFEFWSD